MAFEQLKVAEIYDGAEGDLFELVFGEQIHVGGLDATLDLAKVADIKAGMTGVDLCCCNGASMAVLVEQLGVRSMVGVDISGRVIKRGEDRCSKRGLSDQIRFVQADACDSGLPSGSADFVWSEDAWVYVENKTKLISEAVRLVNDKGVIAFSDWVTGPAGLSHEESELLRSSMHFHFQSQNEYCDLLATAGCSVELAEDTKLLEPQMLLMGQMLDTQYKYAAQQLVPGEPARVDEMVAGFLMIAAMAGANKLAQVRIVARKQ